MLKQECGWKGGDRGGLAERKKKEQIHGKSKENIDRDRPSHGRTERLVPRCESYEQSLPPVAPQSIVMLVTAEFRGPMRHYRTNVGHILRWVLASDRENAA
jgi:hypothetical protein